MDNVTCSVLRCVAVCCSVNNVTCSNDAQVDPEQVIMEGWLSKETKGSFLNTTQKRWCALQHTATHCNTLQHAVTQGGFLINTQKRWCGLQRTASFGNTP